MKNREEVISLLDKSNAILTEVNRKYRSLIKNLQGIVFRCQNNPAYTMEFISEGCLAITGHTPQAFLKGEVCFGDIIEPDDNEMLWNEVQKAIVEKRPFELAYRIRDAAGNIKYLRESGHPVFDKNGNIEALEGFITDVTKLKKIASELAKEKEILEKYINTSASIFVVINREQKIELINQKGCEILGWQRHEILNKNWFEGFISKNEKRTIKSLFNEIIEGNIEPPELDNVIITKDKKRKLIQWRGTTLKDDNGKVMSLLISGVDITEQKKVALELQLSEAKNRAILQAIPDLLFIISEQGVYLDAHASDPALFFAPVDELIGKNLADYLPKDISESIMGAFQRSKITGLPQSLEYKIPVKESLKYFESRITPIDQESYLVMVRDITKKKKEELLKDQIRNILRLITENISLWDIACEIITTVEEHLENCLAAILVLDEEQRKLHTLAAPNLPQGFSHSVECIALGEKGGGCGTAAFPTKKVLISEIATDPRWADFKELPLKHGLKSCWSFPILSSNKKVLGAFAIYCDHIRTPSKTEKEMVADMTQLASVAIDQHNVNIALENSNNQLEDYANELEKRVAERTKEVNDTVKKLVEANLNLEDQVQTTKAAKKRALESQALIANVAKNFPKGVILVFNTDMELVLIDGEELNKLRLTKSDFEGKSIDAFPMFSNKQKDKMKENVQSTLNGQHLSFETTLEENTYAANSIPLFVDNKITWALFVYDNVSEQKRVEHNMKEALKKEQELNELKSRFISMASHEFRTPLTAILSSATLIGRLNQAGEEERRMKYVKQIESNVENLVIILNDFLSLSKLEEGKTNFQPELFDLVQLSQLVVDEIETGKKDGQKIVLNHDQPTIFVNLDSKLTRHVLVNLISNAIKYSAENTKIDIAITSKDNKALIQVSDQGIGIPSEEYGNLFDRFFRAKNATNIQGTGLGLHIVKQYTELMGGTVTFKSEVGRGTTFFVEFEMEKN